MSEPFIAEVRIFAGNFAPRGWAFCDGQLLPIAQNTALFSLIGTIYGGDGRTTTALPNMQGRAPMHPGRGPGLTARRLGEKVGVETVALSESQVPSHIHTHVATPVPSTEFPPSATNYAAQAAGGLPYIADAPNADMGAAIQNAGGGQAHNNMQPYLGLYFIIALVGLYPSRS